MNDQFDLIRKWWDTLHPETMGDNDTIRIVKFYGSKAFTTKDKINNVDDFIGMIENEYNRHGVNFGISASAAEFRYKEGEAPSLSTFKRTKSLIVDIDCYVKNSKERINLAAFDHEWNKYLIAQAHTHLYLHFANKYKIYFPVPVLTGVTGGGFQLIYHFDEWLNGDEAKKVFDYLKNCAPDMMKTGITKSILGPVGQIDMKYDPSSFDITHVQRVLYTYNPKYKSQSYAIEIDRKQIIHETAAALHSLTESMEDKHAREQISEFVNKLQNGMYMAFSGKNEFNKQELLNYAKFENIRIRGDRTNITAPEYEVLVQLNDGRSLDLIKDHITIVRETNKVTTMLCPFHSGDSKPSFACYKNSGTGFDIYVDFHDEKKYNIIELYSALNGISKSQAIKEILDIADIKINKTSKKDIRKIEAAEEASFMMDKIDTENYIYYRLANKQKAVVMRHINSGKSYQFDGLKALTRQILQNQLNIEEFDREVLDAFTEAFEKHILLDGFERYEPGAEPVIKENDVYIINMWVPHANYKKSVAKAEELRKELDSKSISLSRAKKLITEKTPWIDLFIRQVVQYGSYDWFLNWMALTVQFKTTPTVPIFHGTFGAGKNTFLEKILSWYLHDENVHVVGTDMITKQFNAFMQQASLIVIDEGDLYDSKGIDALKLFSGNNKVKIEKKGVDVYDVQKKFNLMSFSNRTIPVYLNRQERRFSLFKSTVSLAFTCEALGIELHEFFEKVEAELEDFFGILLIIQTKKEWNNMNMKDGIFHRVMFYSHPFGKLLLALLDNEWDSLALQMTENVEDEADMIAAMNMIEELKKSFEKDGRLPLALVNRYMSSLNYKNRTSVSEFVRNNLLDRYIKNKIINNKVYITIDVESLKPMIKTSNVLFDWFEDHVSGFKEFVEKKGYYSPEKSTSLFQEFLIYARETAAPSIDVDLSDTPVAEPPVMESDLGISAPIAEPPVMESDLGISAPVAEPPVAPVAEPPVAPVAEPPVMESDLGISAPVAEPPVMESDLGISAPVAEPPVKVPPIKHYLEDLGIPIPDIGNEVPIPPTY